VKRLGLIVFHLVATLSLLLCLAAVGAWVWGGTGTLQVGLTTPLSDYVLVVSRGELLVVTNHLLDPLHPYEDDRLGWGWRTAPDENLCSEAQRICPNAHAPVAGFFLGDREDSQGLTLVLLPMALVVALFACLPLVVGVRLVRRRRRAKRLAAGRCIACGYDLRATPERCPECGTIPA
jgi:hypothetical protein